MQLRGLIEVTTISKMNLLDTINFFLSNYWTQISKRDLDLVTPRPSPFSGGQLKGAGGLKPAPRLHLDIEKIYFLLCEV